MPFDLTYIKDLTRLSVTRPRAAAAQVLSLNASLRVALMSVAVAAVLSALITAILERILPAGASPDMPFLISRPILLAVLQAMGMVIFAGLVTGIGRLFGGKGRLVQTLLVLAWFDFLLLGLQLAMLLIMVALPVLGTLVSLSVLALALWILASFIAQLHGFASTARTLASLIALVFFAGMALSLLPPPQ